MILKIHLSTIEMKVIHDIISKMHEYQKKHNVTACCMTNTQILYDLLSSTGRVQVRPCVVVQKDCSIVHLIVLWDDEMILEPSYEVAFLKEKRYIMNLSSIDFSLITQHDKRQFVQWFVDLSKRANEINNGELKFNDRKVYYDQIDLLMKAFPNLITQKHV